MTNEIYDISNEYIFQKGKQMVNKKIKREISKYIRAMTM